jgi:hypothetical protein
MAKTQSTKKGKPTSSSDDLLKGGKKGGVELREDELRKVSGGAKLDKVTISGKD